MPEKEKNERVLEHVLGLKTAKKPACLPILSTTERVSLERLRLSAHDYLPQSKKKGGE